MRAEAAITCGYRVQGARFGEPFIAVAGPLHATIEECAAEGTHVQFKPSHRLFLITRAFCRSVMSFPGRRSTASS